jgi:pimeloyl-ACP methyl ester carboxylesterase
MKKLGIAVPMVVILSLVVMVTGCGSSTSGKPSTSVPATNSQGVPNYANSSNWLSLPAKTTKKVDVFYLGDTTYQKPNANAPNICAINDAQMRAGAKAKFSASATAFAPIANIYSPYYRQSDASVLLLPHTQQSAIIAGIPTHDGLSAFDYYIKHLNQERPFFMAGHSQGSNVTINLLAQYMKKNPDVYKRMIAAYVIGYSITPDYLAQNPELKFATGPDDTRVIISYNTEAPVLKGTNPVVLPRAMAINPITWTRAETLAPASQNLGGISVNPQTGYAVVDASGNPVKVMNYADAQVNTARGAVICSTADPSQLAPGNQLVSNGVYHPFDYPFYYFDVSANAANRVAKYFAKK